MSSDESIQEDLGVIISASSLKLNKSFTEKLEDLAVSQSNSTNTKWKKLWEFFKIQVLGYPNEFERFVLESEPNDCSLIAKYSQVQTINLSNQSTSSVDSITLNTLHIPHPLESFLRNEANNIPEDDLDLSKELQESPIIIFIHGLGGQMSQFEPLMALLAQCSEVYSLDLPGFGNSKLEFLNDRKIISEFTPEEKLRISSSIKKLTWNDFKTENIVNIIYEFIIQNIPKGKKVVLVGHSMGTHLSVLVGKKLPKYTVEGLILLSPPPFQDDITENAPETPKPSTISMLQVFTYLPWLFNSFRVWDRLEGLESTSVVRQLVRFESIKTSIYNKLRQLRWNMDVNSYIVLRYINGFSKAKYSDIITTISQFNDNAKDTRVYEKTLLVGGINDQVTSIKVIDNTDTFLTKFFKRRISKTIEVNGTGHSILLGKPEFISGMILNHIEQKFPERLHLSPAWVLKVKAKISGDKWGLKNERKWKEIKGISSNITRKSGSDISPLLGMKTLREDDEVHSPKIIEDLFYGKNKDSRSEDFPKGNLIAIVDISHDIPPYSPKSFEIIKYYKCATVSKVVPDQVSIRRFIQLIDDILNNNEIDNPLVAVHCHYGFNRTGFLICCYLVERLGWSVADAVEGFKSAKAPGIKHPHFIDALYVRYER
ncbi:uncharacterized protein RJT21DRAFT_122482 [Scheffersomyces amazonensis]|uniref:uncharacterized protein n=1 Tax=Scheffersomyces amazonensis TaxID=1078765 RepID=UPI00315DEF93